MTRLEPKHWALIGTYLTSTGLGLAGLHGWSDVTPLVVAGLLGQTGALLFAIFAGPPQNPNLSPINNPGRRADDPDPPPSLGSVSDATRSKL